MKIRILSLAGCLIVAVILVTIGFNLHTMHTANAKGSTQVDLVKACKTAPVVDGFGQVTLSKSLPIQNVSLTITVPCEIDLTNGASLNIQNSQLVTDKLVILDDPSQPSPSQISIVNSSLRSAQGGLFIRFQQGGNISVVHSTIDYPLSVSLAMSDINDQDGYLDVESSIIRSNGSSSEGIVLVSTDKGRFIGNKFSTTADSHLAILSASACQMANNSGTLPKCANQ
jgi:hypothetical protein